MSDMGFIYSKPPCKGCEDRHTGCHSKCPNYIEWDRTRKEAEAKARKSYEAEHDAVGYMMSEVAKRRRKH